MRSYVNRRSTQKVLDSLEDYPVVALLGARQAGKSKFQEQSKNSSWKLRPSASYKFNTRVQGSMFFETGATENKISGKYSYSEFGINVNIAIRD